jgi:DNA-binding protein Fis
LISAEDRHCADIQSRARQMLNPMLYFQGASDLLKGKPVQYRDSFDGDERIITRATADEFLTSLNEYLGIEQHKKTRMKKRTAAKKELRKDPAYREKENASNRVEHDPQREANRQAISQYFADLYGDPTFDDIRIVAFKRDVTPIINKALRTKKENAASLVATLHERLMALVETQRAKERERAKSGMAVIRSRNTPRDELPGGTNEGEQPIDIPIDDGLRDGGSV